MLYSTSLVFTPNAANASKRKLLHGSSASYHYWEQVNGPLGSYEAKHDGSRNETTRELREARNEVLLRTVRTETNSTTKQQTRSSIIFAWRPF
ncbi:hypothetical protein BV898_19090 [Hypsibius exemplaris]|uniref:Uncharacterized protein n=1 Tax=Hypsibius exemplaris TaxID=2072580 RepID=A0A9X6NL11_HYPEX|nr:hypothetical protein BV898_19090 [Hypsibius exemplaris]